jgi:hypothetical protein
MGLLQMGKELGLVLKFQSIRHAEKGQMEDGGLPRKPPQRESWRPQRRKTARTAKEKLPVPEQETLVPATKERSAKVPPRWEAPTSWPSGEAVRTHTAMKTAAEAAAVEAAAHARSPAPRADREETQH